MIIAETTAECRRQRAGFEKLAFVPTMGALHAGHVSLMELGRRHAPVCVSIFVNPTQFGPAEDFGKYPRPVEADLKMCREAGVDLVFMPSAEEMYRPGLPKIEIDLPQLTHVLDGAHRAGHFQGVCQVVAKLFNIVQPNVAVFGRKDFQQLRIIQAMVEALDFPVEIVPGETVREPDGLAMSSRNRYLSPGERQRALSISRGLFRAGAEIQRGVRQASELIAIISDALIEQQLSIDYVAAVDPTTLQPVEMVTGPTIFAVAARVGATRLIDNVLYR